MNNYSIGYIYLGVPDNFTFPGTNEMWMLWTDTDWSDGSISDYGYESHSIDRMIDAVLCLECLQEVEDEFLAELPF